MTLSIPTFFKTLPTTPILSTDIGTNFVCDHFHLLIHSPFLFFCCKGDIPVFASKRFRNTSYRSLSLSNPSFHKNLKNASQYAFSSAFVFFRSAINGLFSSLFFLFRSSFIFWFCSQNILAVSGVPFNPDFLALILEFD